MNRYQIRFQVRHAIVLTVVAALVFGVHEHLKLRRELRRQREAARDHWRDELGESLDAVKNMDSSTIENVMAQARETPQAIVFSLADWDMMARAAKKDLPDFLVELYDSFPDAPVRIYFIQADQGPFPFRSHDGPKVAWLRHGKVVSEQFLKPWQLGNTTELLETTRNAFDLD